MYVNLRALNICMSYKQTTRIVDLLSEDHDVKVKLWADELVKLIELPPERVC